MPKLRSLVAGGEIAELTPSFPCVTCPVQANMTTGKRPAEHGIVANGLYWRDRRQVEMWTAPNDCIESAADLGPALAPRRRADFGRMVSRCTAKAARPITSARPRRSTIRTARNRSGAIRGRWNCTAQLRDALGHFPLQNYWGPMAGVAVDGRGSPIRPCSPPRRWQPDFFYIYLPHLDYAAQRTGPDSAAAQAAVAELDECDRHARRRHCARPTATSRSGCVAGEYAITPVDHVSYPESRAPRGGPAGRSRRRRTANISTSSGSRAFALVDHQFSHVFVADGDRCDRAARWPNCFAVSRASPRCWWATERGRYRPGSSPQRRGHADLHAQ